MRWRAIGLGLLLIGLACQSESTYREQIERYRADREERLRKPDGWLTLVGLFWLETGENRFGSDPANPIVFPEGSAPPLAGVLDYDGSAVRLLAEPDAGITVNDEPVVERELTADDVIRLGRLIFFLIERDGRHALRVKDPESPVRQDFHGLDYFPIDPDYRVVARFRRFDEPERMAVPTVVGTTEQQFVLGVAEFSLHGKRYALKPLVDDPSETELFFIIKDETSGKETYGAGRYFYADLEGDRVVVDFNKAYNPPCVFTPYATCPLPPRENWLQARIEAGEKVYGEH